MRPGATTIARNTLSTVLPSQVNTTPVSDVAGALFSPHQRCAGSSGLAASPPHSPGLSPALLVHGPQLLLGDGQLRRVHHLGLPVAVGELQRPVPLALGLTHHRVGGVVLHLRCHSAPQQRKKRGEGGGGLVFRCTILGLGSSRQPRCLSGGGLAGVLG